MKLPVKSILALTGAAAVLLPAAPALAKGGSSEHGATRSKSSLPSPSYDSNRGRILREFARAGRHSDLRANWNGKSHANWNAGFDCDPDSP